jgi:hypothetical protein
LREERPQLAGCRQRVDGGTKLVDIFLAEVPRVVARGLLEHLRMRELLVQLE